MDGLYEFNIPTPMGNMKSMLKIITCGNAFKGYFDMMGKRSEFSNGKINGNTMNITGSYSSGMFKIQYNISGNVQGDTLYLCAQTNMGNFNLQGKRIGR